MYEKMGLRFTDCQWYNTDCQWHTFYTGSNVCDQNGDEYKYFNENNDSHQWAQLCFSVRKLYFVIVILFVADLMLFYMHL